MSNVMEDVMDLWAKINWLDRIEIQTVLENYGFAVFDDESTQGLRQELYENIVDGTIPEDELD